MRRMILVLTVAAMMAAMMVASAMPASAAASDNSSCKGQVFSDILEPGPEKGELVSESAKEFGGLGQSFGEPLRSCNPNANPNGGARP
jgi:hypothetical protein